MVCLFVRTPHPPFGHPLPQNGARGSAFVCSFARPRLGGNGQGAGVWRGYLNLTPRSNCLAILLTFIACLLVFASPSFGQYGTSQGGVPQTTLPKPLVNVGIDQRLNES